jgi:hypothetical protein
MIHFVMENEYGLNWRYMLGLSNINIGLDDPAAPAVDLAPAPSRKIEI